MIGCLLNENSVLIWNNKDVTDLRVKHRIVGSLIGSLPSQPKQNNDYGLPLLLMAEETNLLIEQGVLRVRRFHDVLRTLSPSEQEQIKQLYKQLVEVDQHYQCDSFLSKTDAACLSEERSLLKRHNFSPLVSIHTEYPFDTIKRNIHFQQDDKTSNNNNTVVSGTTANISNEDVATPIDKETIEIRGDKEQEDLCWKWPQTYEEVLKYTVFKDLWTKGFYVTAGLKFGGDYLVYENDPLCVHSSFIAKIIHWNDPIKMSDLVIAGRLGGKVKKQTLLCSLNPQDNLTVRYLTLYWSGNVS